MLEMVDLRVGVSERKLKQAIHYTILVCQQMEPINNVEAVLLNGERQGERKKR